MQLKYVKLLRFLIAGGTAATAEYATFLLLLGGLGAVYAHVISFSCGLVISFVMNKKWVFNMVGNARRQFTLYMSLAIANLMISSILIVIAVQTLQFNELIAKFMIMLIIAVWNYIIFNLFIFKKTIT